MIFLLIAFGSAGTLARYAMEGWVQHRAKAVFPFGTLSVNLLGCFLLGAIGTFALSHLSFPPDLRVGITIGFFGAFTTFSTFGWETVRMLQDGEWRSAITYVAASVLGGLAAVLAGIRLGGAI